MNLLRTVLVVLSILLVVPHCPAEAASAAPSKKGGAALSLESEKGMFRVTLDVDRGGLDIGLNSFFLNVRDKQNRSVDGAEITITPWMPEHGHGVWEKPVVTGRGGGSYSVGNVSLVMGGQWDIRVAVKKGSLQDEAVFRFAVGAEARSGAAAAAKSKQDYTRTVEYYKVPNVTLLNQDGQRISLRTLVDGDAPVIIDFIYTTCTTICPVLSAAFANLQDELTDNTMRARLVSISIDPEHDRPDQMKEYLSRYDAKPGWDFLTGSREDITLVLKAFNASVADKMAHLPLYVMHGPKSDEWIRIYGLIGSADFMREFRKLEAR